MSAGEAPAGVRLAYTGAFDWPAVLRFLSARAVEGVELVDAGVYRRTVRCGDGPGILEVAHDEANRVLVATLVRFDSPHLREDDDTRVQRVRWMFDLDAPLATINAHLARDPSMAPLVAARPAVRVFRGWDPFEVAVRSIIGQQVSVARARHLNGVLVQRCRAGAGIMPLRCLFPTPEEVMAADLSAMGMPGARVATIAAVAQASLDNPRLFDRGESIEDTVARLRAIRGVGDWTAHYIAMRACGEPDAFPASDVGLLRGAADASGRRPTPRELSARAEAWRPWRAYAAHHLWAADG